MSPDTRESDEVSLTLPANPRFAGPASHLIEDIGQAFDMPPETWRGLSLACEEVVSHVARYAEAGSPVTVVCRDDRYRMVLDVSLPAKGFDPRMFNITQSVRPDDEMDELGLLLAARMVDEFTFDREGNRLRLTLRKARPYPRLKDVGDPLPALVQGGTKWTLRAPSPDRLASLCRLIAAIGGAPTFLSFPDRVVDMAAVGDLDGIVAEDGAGRVIGGGLWFRSGRIVEFIGPYHAGGDPALAEALVEACLIAEARGAAQGVICRHPGPAFPAGMFETIGSLAPTAKAPGCAVRFRELREDPGATVWAVPEIDAFLRAAYDNLGLARGLMPPILGGGRVEPHSVIAAATNCEDGSAVLRPVLPGADATENIARHCRHLEETGFADLLCEVDLGRSWQVDFCSGLIASGFEPRFIIPYGGESDILVLQRAAEGVK